MNSNFSLAAGHLALIYMLGEVQAINTVIQMFSKGTNIHNHQHLGICAHVLLEQVRQLRVSEGYVFISLEYGTYHIFQSCKMLVDCSCFFLPLSYHSWCVDVLRPCEVYQVQRSSFPILTFTFGSNPELIDAMAAARCFVEIRLGKWSVLISLRQ